MKATDEQKRLWLLAAESVRADRRDGAVRLEGNRYWADFLHDHLGQPMVVRFDPQDMHSGVHVYRLDGGYVGYAECHEAAGFDSADAAREHNRARKAWMKATKAAADAELAMSPADVAAMIPPIAAAPAPDTKVVQATFGGGDRSAVAKAAAAPRRQVPKAAPLTDAQKQAQAEIEAEMAGTPEPARVVMLPLADQKEARFARAMEIEGRQAAGQAVDAQDVAWLTGYQRTPEYTSRKGMLDDFKDFGAQARA